ncbi:NUDIX domain-containing protein [Catenovulum maritimum]|uniref:ADP-ribose pyrophosphatase n=1 Tax=Catenovulum maritimum TaxID=1513271 RepID=A0A0J8GMY7_9ALTE|nr:NUDIX domain-containing protein [Catenovulum maritimum]KMT64182.1 ADP-ribose pyrophosphatase [Catenovulum maritimum]
MNKQDKPFPYTFNTEDIKLESKEKLFDRFFNVSLVSFKHKLFAGGWSDTVQREVFERSDAVVVLPYDITRDDIVMIEQVRVGCIENGENPWMFELVGGMVEEGESIEDVAKRETEEETGLSVKQLVSMQSYLSSCGGTSERIHLYLAIVDSTQYKSICGVEHEHEDIKVHVFEREQVLAWLNAGKIDNASGVIALYWFQNNLTRLNQMLEA